ncbi:MAG: zinc ribbon domain-containing protein [Promethearchaeota archaeon]
MVQQDQSFCSECGNPVKKGQSFCSYCGSKLSEIAVTNITSRAQLQFPIKGWEIAPERVKKYEKAMQELPIGDPIITSKCKLDRAFGLLIVSDVGFAWIIKETMRTSRWNIGKKKWVRWHDVYSIVPKYQGQIQVTVKIRKNGTLQLDNDGNYKTKRWKLTINKNKREEEAHWRDRQASFNNIMLEIYNRNKGETDPPTSDSRI